MMAGNSQTARKPAETALSRAAGAKSIGMIDRLRLRRLQCCGCGYRSNHRADMRRHIRTKHSGPTGGIGCRGWINVLSVEVAAATLNAYRRRCGRGKAAHTDPATSKTQCSSRQQCRGKACGKVGQKDETGKKLSDEEAGSGGGVKPSWKVKAGPTGTVKSGGGRVESVDDGGGRVDVEWGEGGVGGRGSGRAEWWWTRWQDADDETKCCDVCPFKTDRTGLLELHKLRHRAPPAAAAAAAVNTFSCRHCPYYVRTARQLERHTALHDDVSSTTHATATAAAAAAAVPLHGLQPANTRYVCDRYSKVKFTDIAVRSQTCHTATGTHMPYGITQCYLPPDRGDLTAFTPAEAGTRFSDPGGTQG